MQRKDDTVKPHTVLEEIEPGYIYRDKVIRHAKVIVSEDIAEEDSAQGKNDSEQETT
jgi:molecular chaperone GrpE